jgi:hypothetical protein
VGSTLAQRGALRASGSSQPDALRASGSSQPDALRASGSSASWQDRVVVGDLGYRAKAVLTRHTNGIMFERSGATTLWIPEPSVTAIRTERGLAGKVLTHHGILAIRWRLPSGTEIDTGFRGDDRRKYALWVEAR